MPCANGGDWVEGWLVWNVLGKPADADWQHNLPLPLTRRFTNSTTSSSSAKAMMQQLQPLMLSNTPSNTPNHNNDVERLRCIDVG